MPQLNNNQIFNERKVCNTLREKLLEIGFDNARPSKEFLKTIDSSVKMWNMWIHKKKDPTLYQLIRISEFLNCDLLDLIYIHDNETV